MITPRSKSYEGAKDDAGQDAREWGWKLERSPSKRAAAVGYSSEWHAN